MFNGFTNITAPTLNGLDTIDADTITTSTITATSTDTTTLIVNGVDVSTQLNQIPINTNNIATLQQITSGQSYDDLTDTTNFDNNFSIWGNVLTMSGSDPLIQTTSNSNLVVSTPSGSTGFLIFRTQETDRFYIDTDGNSTFNYPLSLLNSNPNDRTINSTYYNINDDNFSAGGINRGRMYSNASYFFLELNTDHTYVIKIDGTTVFDISYYYATFLFPPRCNITPTYGEELCNKTYVDSLVGALNIITNNTSSVFYPVFVPSAGIVQGRIDNLTNPLSYIPSSSTLTCSNFTGTSAYSTQVNVTDDDSNATMYLVFATSGVGQKSLLFDSTTTPLTYNPFVGSLTTGYLTARDNSSINRLFLGTKNGYSMYFGLNTAGLPNLTTGDYNVIIGGNTGLSLTAGSNNFMMGYNCGLNLKSSSGNTLVGHRTGLVLGFSDLPFTQSNCAIGDAALTNGDNVAYVTAIGPESGLSILNNNLFCTVIGGRSDCSDGLQYATAIGAFATVTTNNTVQLGRTADNVNCPNTVTIGSKLTMNSSTAANRVISNTFYDLYDTTGTGTYRGTIYADTLNSYVKMANNPTADTTFKIVMTKATVDTPTFTSNAIDGTVIQARLQGSSTPVLLLRDYTGSHANNDLNFLTSAGGGSYNYMVNYGDSAIISRNTYSAIHQPLTIAVTGNTSSGIRLQSNQIDIGVGGTSPNPTTRFIITTTDIRTTATMPASSDSSTVVPSTAWVQGCLSNYITLTTTQTSISGQKSFTNTSNIYYGSGVNLTGINTSTISTTTLPSSGTYYLPYLSSSTGASAQTLYTDSNLSFDRTNTNLTVPNLTVTGTTIILSGTEPKIQTTGNNSLYLSTAVGSTGWLVFQTQGITRFTIATGGASRYYGAIALLNADANYRNIDFTYFNMIDNNGSGTYRGRIYSDTASCYVELNAGHIYKINIGGSNVFEINSTTATFLADTIYLTGSSFSVGRGAGSLSNTLLGYGTPSTVSFTSGNNTLIGSLTGQSLTTAASSNTFVGSSAGSTVTSGSSNTIIGNGAGTNLLTGNSNTFIGNNAGDIVTGSNNICIGASSAPPFLFDSNQIAIGTANENMSIRGGFCFKSGGSILSSVTLPNILPQFYAVSMGVVSQTITLPISPYTGAYLILKRKVNTTAFTINGNGYNLVPIASITSVVSIAVPSTVFQMELFFDGVNWNVIGQT